MNHNCLVVTVEAGMVIRFEEYSGQMDPALLLPVMQAQLGQGHPAAASPNPLRS